MSFSVRLHRGQSTPFTQQKPAVQVPQKCDRHLRPCLVSHQPAGFPPARQACLSSCPVSCEPQSRLLSRTLKWSSPVSASQRSCFARGVRVRGGDTGDSRERSPSAQAGFSLIYGHTRVPDLVRRGYDYHPPFYRPVGGAQRAQQACPNLHAKKEAGPGLEPGVVGTPSHAASQRVPGNKCTWLFAADLCCAGNTVGDRARAQGQRADTSAGRSGGWEGQVPRRPLTFDPWF